MIKRESYDPFKFQYETLAEFQVFLSPNVKHSTRNTPQLFDILGFLGGILDIFVIFISVFVSPYIQARYTARLVDKVLISHGEKPMKNSYTCVKLCCPKSLQRGGKFSRINQIEEHIN